MKKLLLLSLASLAFVSCQKGQTNPTKPVTVVKDTIPDKSAFNVAIVKDSTYYFDSALIFGHTFHDNYVPGEDATTMGGAVVQLTFLSSDGISLGADEVPYKPGMIVKAVVRASSSGAYFIRAQRLFGIPESIQIWVRDKLLKDSLELHTGNYHFNIDKTDTNTFGKHRFEIVIRPK